MKKRKKEECEPTAPEDKRGGKQEDGRRGTASPLSSLAFKEPPEKKVRRGRCAGTMKIHQFEGSLL